MSKKSQYAIIYSTGAFVYPIIEIVWRGFSHWTMSILGGVCFLAIYIKELYSSGKSLISRCFTGACIITSLECVSGFIVNKLFKMNVWDYSKLKFNFYGQICVRYAFLWFLLCIPICYVCKFFRSSFNSKSKL